MSSNESALKFGFLPYNWEIKFSHGIITPVSDFDSRLKAVVKNLNEDGNFYPPTVKTVRLTERGQRTIPKTKRPAHLYQLPASHELRIKIDQPEHDIRKQSAAFVIHFLAFVFRTRLQFADWFFDGRVPIKKQRGIGEIIFNPAQAGAYLSAAYDIWSKWPLSERTRFISILYMFSRTAIYEWDWEEFMIEYMILDACWKMGERLFKFRSKKHADRLQEICTHFSLSYDKSIIDMEKMVELRNDLLHETLWFEDRPGSTIGKLGYHMPTRMWMINEEIIAKFLQLP